MMEYKASHSSTDSGPERSLERGFFKVRSQNSELDGTMELEKKVLTPTSRKEGKEAPNFSFF